MDSLVGQARGRGVAMLRSLVSLPALLMVLVLTTSVPALAAGETPVLEPFSSARVGAWALPGIAFLSAEGILHGVAKGRLGGTDFVTQEQAITLIGRTLGWTPKWPQNPSPQVDGFAQAYVAMATTLGVTPTFPRAPTSRLQAVQWLVKLLGLPLATIPNPFTDVPDALAPAVLSAVQAGIVQGNSPNTFNPLGEVTRAEFVAMLFSAQIAQQSSGAVQVSGATYFNRSGLALVRQDPNDWTLLSGSTGLRSVAGVLRPVTVQGQGASLLVTETLAGAQSELTITKSGSTLTTPSGKSVTLPAGVPAAAGAFLLPLP